MCTALKNAGHEPLFAAKTGLLLDPYFSGTKLAWLLARPGIGERAARGELAFGTVDTFLLWRLTGGKVHATDATNASRTLLFDIREGRWDDQLLKPVSYTHLSTCRRILPRTTPRQLLLRRNKSFRHAIQPVGNIAYCDSPEGNEARALADTFTH